ncbi:MAG: type II toxin-antitoxin system prevent-host-death family antitoxin [Verrucomicrobia bacterium]|nr:type II toxin-antitoxin system prevent-host-death family antitoxin [Verrucomicrobiota bacterium]
MPSYNVHDAKTHFSKLLDDVLQGQEVLITRNGLPVAELVPARKRAFPLGLGRNDSHINREFLLADEWWRPMSEEELAAFLEGRD